MKRMLILLGVVFTLAHSVAQETDGTDFKMKSILAGFDAREKADDSTKAHKAWLKTEVGKEQVAFLASHYESLSDGRKYSVPTELAATGLPEVVPLLKRALTDGKYGLHVLAGIFYAVHFSKPGKDFCQPLAPLILPWIGKGIISSKDSAIDLLPLLDEKLAARTFFCDAYLSPDAPRVHLVLASCNEAEMTVPLDRIQILLDAWKQKGTAKDSEYRIIRGYREAIRALARHDSKQALEVVESIVRTNPADADKYSEIPLAAAGLGGLYNRLCDYAEDDAKFELLPEPAKIFYAVTCFEADSSNGGIGQALGNSTGDYLPLVKKGYAEIGDRLGLRYLDWMCKPFGPEGPSADRNKRNQQMEDMTPPYGEQEDTLHEAWCDKMRDEPRTSTAWLLNRYAAKHAEELRPLLEKARH